MFNSPSSFCIAALAALAPFVSAETLKINGSTTVNLPVAEASEILPL